MKGINCFAKKSGLLLNLTISISCVKIPNWIADGVSEKMFASTPGVNLAMGHSLF